MRWPLRLWFVLWIVLVGYAGVTKNADMMAWVLTVSVLSVVALVGLLMVSVGDDGDDR